MQKGFGDCRSGDPLFYKMISNRPKPDIHTMEILAPAGSVLAARAAAEAGADAVYIGGSRFGARAYADNPGEEELLELIDDLHLRRKKIYLTVNTLLKEKEVSKELYSYLAPYYEAGLDAVIVQDPGVMQFILREFPEMAVHASTQMTITGPSGAQMLEKQGVTRVVPARELSLQEIRAIRDATGLEIECFVHGALCYCYSGRCLLSSMLGGRSGNRGRCAQPCRLPYTVSDRTGRLNGPDEQYMLSPKDMCTVDLLPEIVAAGVTSLKIEGRMKKPEYTAGVVSIYRKYLDQTLSGSFKGVTKQDRQILFDLYNRDGFHQSYYKQHNGKQMMALKNEKLEKTAGDRNEALFSAIHRQYCENETKLSVNGLASFCEGEPMSLFLQAGREFCLCDSGDSADSQKSSHGRSTGQKTAGKNRRFFVCLRGADCRDAWCVFCSGKGTECPSPGGSCCLKRNHASSVPQNLSANFYYKKGRVSGTSWQAGNSCACQHRGTAGCCACTEATARTDLYGIYTMAAQKTDSRKRKRSGRYPMDPGTSTDAQGIVQRRFPETSSTAGTVPL